MSISDKPHLALKSAKYLLSFGVGLIIFLSEFSIASATGLNITYPSQAFTATSSLTVVTSSQPINLPWQWDALAPVYNYNVTSTGFYDPSRPLNLKINYGAANGYLKQIFIFDSWANLWRPLPTADFPDKHYVTAQTTSLSGQLLLAADTNYMTYGTASWYRYKNGLFTASPDYPKGSVLTVTNLANNKSVDVTVNDYGPERALYPHRVVDLDYQAFKAIAHPSIGLINVQVVPKKIVGVKTNKALQPATSSPKITAWSAAIMSEKTGRILWEKNDSKVTPLASLSKLVAIRVFLDTKPSLNKVVSYKQQDANYNYQYVKPWESARVHLKNGETVTEKDLLYSALVGSANNAVESLVRVSGLSRPDFIARMNKLVQSWGATNTKFVEPTGLSPNNVSSPLDYAIIAKEVFTNPLLEKITTTKSYSFETINTHKWHTIRNTDSLLRTNAYNIIGSKTGFLNEAKYCLLVRIKSAKGNLIVVDFGSNTRADSFSDAQKMIHYGLKLLMSK